MSRNNKSHRKHRYKKLIKHFPCKECITLPICRNKYNTQRNVVSIIIDECSIINEYLERQITPVKSNTKRTYKECSVVREKENIIRKFFRSYKLKDKTQL